MATAVERPISALSDISVASQRQRRPSVMEVIDVDLFDDPEATSRPISRPISRLTRPLLRSRQTRESDTIISLVDSDNELPMAPPVASGSVSARLGNRQRLFSPPPQLQEPRNIPPVPPVPGRYSAFVSPPMRRHPPAFAAPPVVPIAQPFAFEAAIAQPPPGPVAGPSGMRNHPNRNRRIPISPPLQAAAPSHHQPPLGLGGAIISLNRAHADARLQQRRDHNRQRAHAFSQVQEGLISRAGTMIRRVFRATVPRMGFDSESEDVDDDAPALHMLLAGDERFGHPARGYASREMMLQRYGNHGRTQNIEYKPEYTHPDKPELGFTFDFAPPSFTEETTEKPKAKSPPIVIDLEAMENDGPIAGPSTLAEPSSPTSTGPLSLQTLLVCARCLDPLVLGGGLVGENGRSRKVWALRCGHMIDGKCLDMVGVPNTEETDRQEVEKVPVDVKGKGKAKAVEEPTPPVENHIRSRLRSRPQTHIPSSSSSTPVLPQRPDPTPQSPEVHLGKRKRGRAPAKPQVEFSHEWTCPVAGCGKVHASVKMSGVWVPEPLVSPNGSGKGKRRARWGIGGPIYEADNSKPTGGRGAIAVFV